MTDNIYTTSVSFAEAAKINNEIGEYYKTGEQYTNGTHTIAVKHTDGYSVYFAIVIDGIEYTDEEDAFTYPYFCKNSALLYKNGYRKA